MTNPVEVNMQAKLLFTQKRVAESNPGWKSQSIFPIASTGLQQRVLPGVPPLSTVSVIPSGKLLCPRRSNDESDKKGREYGTELAVPVRPREMCATPFWTEAVESEGGFRLSEEGPAGSKVKGE